MALPDTGGRGDAVAMVALDPSSPSTFTNLCGLKNFNLSIDNEIHSEKVGDCDDWSAPVETIRSYSGQNITASADATWTAAQHDKISDWALDQLTLPVRIHFPNATTGQVEYYDGKALLGGLSIGDIGNLDGNPITENITLEFTGNFTKTKKS